MSANVYHIDDDVGFYRQLSTLLIATVGVGQAAQAHVHGAIQIEEGQYLAIEGKHLSNEVRLPFFGPVQAALKDIKLDIIEITIVEEIDAMKEYEYKTSGLQQFITSLYQPFFVNYYEQERDAVKQSVGHDRTDRTDAWQMGWLVRNAASHGNTVHFSRSSQTGVSWRGLSLDPSDQGTEVVGNLITGGDIVQLLIDMEDDLRGLQPQNTHDEDPAG